MIWPFSSKLTNLQRGNRKLVAKKYAAAIRLFLAHADEVPGEAATAFAKVAECYKRCNVLRQPIVVGNDLTLVSQGDLANAERYYRLALDRDPRHFAALKGLAEISADRAADTEMSLEKAP